MLWPPPPGASPNWLVVNPPSISTLRIVTLSAKTLMLAPSVKGTSPTTGPGWGSPRAVWGLAGLGKPRGGGGVDDDSGAPVVSGGAVVAEVGGGLRVGVAAGG